MDNINLKYVIEIDSTLLSALKKMDEEGIKLLLVFNQYLRLKFYGGLFNKKYFYVKFIKYTIER